jgi:ribosome-associated toxin RatA of RatAB toxin-antitoxin module
MPVVKKSAWVPYSAEKMYHLVNDVALYPDFLPWCAETQIIEQSDTRMLASLCIAKGPFREKFTTENKLMPHRHIHLSLVDGPFSLLEGDWRFIPEEPGPEEGPEKGSRVNLELHFEFRSGFVSRLISPVFEGIANRFVDAFCARAVQLYGGSKLA